MPVKLVSNIVIFFGKTKQKVRVNVKDTLCPFLCNPSCFVLGLMGKGYQSMTFLQLLEHTFTLLVWWGLTQWPSDPCDLGLRLVISDSGLSINTHVIAIRLRCWNVDNPLTKSWPVEPQIVGEYGLVGIEQSNKILFVNLNFTKRIDSTMSLL